MSPSAERLDFIMRFRDNYPDKSREECIRAANQLLRLARTHQRLAEEECNGPGDWIHHIPYPRAGQLMDEWQAGLEKRQERCQARIQALCDAWALPVRLGGDPRGYTTKVKFADGAYNTWGGAEEGWGCPTS